MKSSFSSSGLIMPKWKLTIYRAVLNLKSNIKVQWNLWCSSKNIHVFLRKFNFSLLMIEIIKKLCWFIQKLFQFHKNKMKWQRTNISTVWINKKINNIKKYEWSHVKIPRHSIKIKFLLSIVVRFQSFEDFLKNAAGKAVTEMNISKENGNFLPELTNIDL